MNHCPKCQKELPEKAKFCPGCGHHFVNETTDPDFVLLQKHLEPEFKIEKKLAIGGMAKVYIGEQPSLERKITIKIMLEQYAKDKEIHDRFLLEARTIAKVHHPNIIHVINSGVIEDRPYFIMEYMEKGALSKFLKSSDGKKNFNFIAALKMIEKILAGLKAAHEKGIIHRDIKPENILLHSNDEPVIVDFGIAKLMNSVMQTSAGTMIGTVDYMSPEQCKGDPEIDGRSDIYSVGIMLYEMLIGETPFTGENPYTIVNKHISEKLPSVSQKISRISKDTLITQLQSHDINELQKILEKACAKNKEDRFQTADEFIGALKNLRHEIASYTVVTETKKRFGLKVTIALLILAMLGGSVWYYFYQKNKAEKEAIEQAKIFPLAGWVTSIYGKVSSKNVNLQQGDKIYKNESVTTARRTFADFQISDTTLEVIFGAKENTVFEFRELKENNKHQIIFDIKKGEVIYDIRKIGKNQEVKVITPEIIGSIKGIDVSQKAETRFRVDVKNNVSSNIELIKGNVVIRPTIAEKVEENLQNSDWSREEAKPILEELKSKSIVLNEPGMKTSVSKRSIEKNWRKLGLKPGDEIIKHKKLIKAEEKAKHFQFRFKTEQLDYEEFIKRRKEADELVYISRSEIEKSKNVQELIRKKNKQNEKVLLKRIGKIKRKEPNILILKNGKKISGLIYENKPGVYTVETVNGDIENYPRNQVDSIEFF